MSVAQQAAELREKIENLEIRYFALCDKYGDRSKVAEDCDKELIELNEKLVSLNDTTPTFEDWCRKYFKDPKNKIVYKQKNGKKVYDRDQLIRKYKRAFKIEPTK